MNHAPGPTVQTPGNLKATSGMLSRRPLRLPLMALGMVALVTALWGGLLRLGWGLPIMSRMLPGAHGPLMVSGFLGTLIGLERAVAIGQRWTYAGPLLTGLGALSLVAGLPGLIGALLMSLGSLGLVAVFAGIVDRKSTRLNSSHSRASRMPSSA